MEEHIVSSVEENWYFERAAKFQAGSMLHQIEKRLK